MYRHIIYYNINIISSHCPALKSATIYASLADWHRIWRSRGWWIRKRGDKPQRRCAPAPAFYLNPHTSPPPLKHQMCKKKKKKERNKRAAYTIHVPFFAAAKGNEEVLTRSLKQLSRVVLNNSGVSIKMLRKKITTFEHVLCEPTVRPSHVTQRISEYPIKTPFHLMTRWTH